MLDLFMLGHGRTHLAEGPAFDQGEVVLHHVGTAPGVEQLLDGHARGKTVLAGVQGVPAMLKRQYKRNQTASSSNPSLCML